MTTAIDRLARGFEGRKRGASAGDHVERLAKQRWQHLLLWQHAG